MSLHKNMAFVFDWRKILSRWKRKMSRRKIIPALLVGDNCSEDQWLKRLAQDRAAEVIGHQLPG